MTASAETRLPDVEAARRHAYAVAREMARHREGMLGHAWREWIMSVKNSKGEQLLLFPLSDALDDSPAGTSSG